MKISYITEAINFQSSLNDLKILSLCPASIPLTSLPNSLSDPTSSYPQLTPHSTQPLLASLVFLELSSFRIFALCCHWSWSLVENALPPPFFHDLLPHPFWSWFRCCLLRSLSLANLSKIAAPPQPHTLHSLSLSPALFFSLWLHITHVAYFFYNSLI